MKVLIGCLLAAASVARAQFTADSMMQPCVFTNSAGNTLNYRLSAPQFPAPGAAYPLVLFLHGSGECGNDNRRQVTVGIPALVATLVKRGEQVIVVAPQCPADGWWVKGLAFEERYAMPAEPAPSLGLALELCRHLVATRQADTNRLYITGLSLGGFGTWDAIQREPTLFAAAIPICGGGDIRRVEGIRRLPIWAFHGTADKNVDVNCSRRMIDVLKLNGSRNARLTLYEGAGHAVWDAPYSDPDVIDWLLSQSRAAKPWWQVW